MESFLNIIKRRKIAAGIFIISFIIDLYFVIFLLIEFDFNGENSRLDRQLFLFLIIFIIYFLGVLFIKPQNRENSLYGIKIDWQHWADRLAITFVLYFGVILITISLALFFSLFNILSILIYGKHLPANWIISVLIIIPQFALYRTIRAWQSRNKPIKERVYKLKL